MNSESSSPSGLDPASNRPQVLATDLDGTLIPLDERADHRDDLVVLARELESSRSTLLFSTGRHLASVLDAMQQHQLPSPEWIICDVGSSIYRGSEGSNKFELAAEYHDALAQIVTEMPLAELQDRLTPFVRAGTLELQESEKQGEFKLSYYSRVATPIREAAVREIRKLLGEWNAPYSMIDSVDPFNGDGLIDLLPHDVSKGYALRWLASHQQWPSQAVVFAGDSGNDLAALTAGFLAIVVGNADPQVAHEAERAHASAGWRRRLYLAEKSATSGVLEGCRWFELF